MPELPKPDFKEASSHRGHAEWLPKDGESFYGGDGLKFECGQDLLLLEDTKTSYKDFPYGAAFIQLKREDGTVVSQGLMPVEAQRDEKNGIYGELYLSCFITTMTFDKFLEEADYNLKVVGYKLDDSPEKAAIFDLIKERDIDELSTSSAMVSRHGASLQAKLDKLRKKIKDPQGYSAASEISEPVIEVQVDTSPLPSNNVPKEKDKKGNEWIDDVLKYSNFKPLPEVTDTEGIIPEARKKWLKVVKDNPENSDEATKVLANAYKKVKPTLNSTDIFLYAKADVDKMKNSMAKEKIASMGMTPKSEGRNTLE